MKWHARWERGHIERKGHSFKNVIFARPAMLLQESLTIYTHISVKDGKDII
ncbi:hypothetical protein QNN00_21045 [Bacillus velezensis]|nr:hypothetical protein [Bacillus velezensis]